MAIEIVYLPIKHGDFSIAMLNYQRLSWQYNSCMVFLGKISFDIDAEWGLETKKRHWRAPPLKPSGF